MEQGRSPRALLKAGGQGWAWRELAYWLPARKAESMVFHEYTACGVRDPDLPSGELRLAAFQPP